MCTECQADLTLQSIHACPLCAHPTPNSDICGSCLLSPPAYQRTLAAYQYHFPLDKLIHALKYQHQFALVDTLINPLLLAEYRADALIAMPLHPLRLRERGYNQSLLLANAISQQNGIPVLTHAASRIRNTPSQAGLALKFRKTNILQAFSADPAQVSGKHIAIIDDVMTSGSTLHSLALSLIQAGASEVSCWVVARAVLK
ncbi:MAG: ComF family protein [Sulfuriferula sp.]|nr:ComF family protein [Sulfuriferula sp.]